MNNTKEDNLSGASLDAPLDYGVLFLNELINGIAIFQATRVCL